MTAAQRLAALDDLPATELIGRTDAILRRLVDVMNEETTLLRAGRHREAAPITNEKTQLAQDYVGLSRAVQREAERLQREAPGGIASLKAGHERLATQIAENLKVIATAKMVTEDLLNDVAQVIARNTRPKTYGAGGQLATPPKGIGGLAVNRAL